MEVWSIINLKGGIGKTTGAKDIKKNGIKATVGEKSNY